MVLAVLTRFVFREAGEFNRKIMSQYTICPGIHGGAIGGWMLGMVYSMMLKGDRFGL